MNFYFCNYEEICNDRPNGSISYNNFSGSTLEPGSAAGAPIVIGQGKSRRFLRVLNRQN